MKTIIAAAASVLTIVVSLTVYTNSLDAKLMAQLESGEKILACLIGKENKTIPFDMIVRQDEHGWKFKNGRAKSCEVTDA